MPHQKVIDCFTMKLELTEQPNRSYKQLLSKHSSATYDAKE